MGKNDANTRTPKKSHDKQTTVDLSKLFYASFSLA